MTGYFRYVYTENPSHRNVNVWFQTLREDNTWNTESRMTFTPRMFRKLYQTTKHCIDFVHGKTQVDKLGQGKLLTKINMPKEYKYINPTSINDNIVSMPDFYIGISHGIYTDNTGFGYPVKNGKYSNQLEIVPSFIHMLPKDATHILWLNNEK